MLVELTAENIAVMERAELSFGPGFTAITGETGAGKSLLVGSISLCLGERADSDLVRTGASRAVVQAVFEPSPDTAALLNELGYEGEDGLLYIQREVASEGRSQCRINGRLAPIGTLRRIGDTLADLHGQHEHQSLLTSANHLATLDAYIGIDAQTLRQAASDGVAKVRALRRKLDELEKGEREREQRLDLLRFQIAEIEEAGVRPGEAEVLESDIKRLKSAEALAALISDASESAYCGEPSAKDLLGRALRSLESASEFDGRLTQTIESLRASLFSLDDSVEGLRTAADNIEFDPARVETIAERLDALSRLKRKYGDTEEDILQFLSVSKETLESLENAEASREQTRAELTSAQEALWKTCGQLTKLRTEKANELCKAVKYELGELAMPGARFSLQFETKEPEPDGADDVEFLFSANAGESEKPLAKIASGGEISRVMLAIKTVMAGRGGVPTLIFDEVDSGLGGQTAAVVAKKLEKLAQHYQVLVITHVPQIASRASAQITISKSEAGGRVTASARQLRADERVEEIARMLAGETVGNAAVENAKQLLATSAPSTE